jgi:hypothetical protein
MIIGSERYAIRAIDFANSSPVCPTLAFGHVVNGLPGTSAGDRKVYDKDYKARSQTKNKYHCGIHRLLHFF